MNSFLDQRKLGILVGAIIVIGIGVYFAGQASDKKEEAGKTALYQVNTTYEEEAKALPEADRAVGTTLDVDAKFPKTVSELNQMVTAKKEPARVLYEAGVKLGTLYLDHNQADKAVVIFKKVTDEASTKFQKASAFFLLGTSEERANQFKEALDSYQSGLTSNVDGLKGELLLGSVRTSMKLNDKEKAKLYLERLNKESPGSRSAEIASSLVKGSQS
jgi:tetratricopeptide (TPR) repeat protein